MITNWLLSALTNPPVKGAVSPLISTKPSERFGDRGGVSPPSGGYDLTNLTYLGAFAIQYSGPREYETDNWNEGRIGFHPPNGSNGTYGSIFVDLHNYFYGIAEFQIPETLGGGSDPFNLPEAVNLQPGLKLDEKAPNNNGNDKIGYMRVIDGKLYLAGYNVYDNSPNSDNLLIFEDATDLANSAVSGWLHVDAEDKACTYMSEIPAEWQSTLGGSWLVGNALGMSIVTRNSFGPSIYVTDLQNLTLQDTQVNTINHLLYPTALKSLASDDYPAPSGSEFADVPNWDAYNEATTKWYEDQLGMTFDEWRTSGKSPAWDTLNPPPSEIQNDLFTILDEVWCAFIVPGTETFLAIGNASMHRYGGGYKIVTSRDRLANGPSPYFEGDTDIFYWAFDMNDILAASDTSTIRPYARGIFDNRWLNQSDASGSDGGVTSGFYDPNTDRLYLAHNGYNDNSATIVSVYQLGANS